MLTTLSIVLCSDFPFPIMYTFEKSSVDSFYPPRF